MKNNHKKPDSFIRQPKFPGGKKALDEFIRTNLVYPEEALKNKIEGVVTVEFDIDADGNISDIVVKHALGYGCDEEAVRLVKLLKYEKKRYRGLRVNFHQNMNIFFRLTNSGAPLQPAQVLHYTLKEESSKKESVITYSIKLN